MPTEKDKPPAKPQGWEKLARDGGRVPAEVGWDEESKRHFHVLASGEIVFHEKPAGTRLHTDKDTGKHTYRPEGYVPHPYGFGLVEPAGLNDRLEERKAREKAEKEPDSSPVAAPAADAKETR